KLSSFKDFLSPCGKMTRDERVNLSGTSNGFSLAGHPAFGLYTSGSGRSEFGGLGSLGLSAMAAHSQFAAFPGEKADDWWRPSEAHTRGAAAFFPPLLGLHPAFVSSLKRHNAADLQSHASGKGKCSITSFFFFVLPGVIVQFHNFVFIKKPHKRQAETSSMSGSQSGSLTESSTDGGESSSDNMEEEEEDDDEEEEESSDSEDSDSEKESAVKGKAKVSAPFFFFFFFVLPLSISGDSNLFLTLHSNGAISGAVQDAPLALITKPQRQSGTPNSKPLLAASSPPYPTPMNLSIGGRHLSGAPSFPHKSSASSGPAPRSRKMKTPKTVNMRKTPVKSNSLLARGSESDVHSSKDSDDSLGDDNDDDDDDEDDIEDEDSGSKLESNLESDSDGSEDNVKECMEAEADSDADRTPPKGAEVTSAPKSSSSSELSANCSLLNLQIPKTPSLHSGLETPTTSTTTWSKHTPSYSFAPVWRRETRIRTVAGRLQGEVAYFAPCGKKLRQYPDVMKGMRWFLLPEDEIVPIIIAMDGRRSRRSKFEPQPPGDGRGIRQWKSHPLNVGEKSFPDVSDAKLLRKLEAQEIARQAAQIKMMRKLEKQAMAQAAKEARKRQALIAAEERRKKREQIKILKQQEKIKRIQQIRMEKELRAQQILEVGPESYCRNILKHFLSAEKERLKKEKKDEKRLNKERKLELRRLELEKAKELKKPNEDLCLADHKPLPELSRIPGLVLSGRTFSDCLMVLQFLHSFGKVLGLGFESSDVLTASDLQEGLLNAGPGMSLVQDLLVNMLSAALRDPGMPAGHKSKTILGDHLTNVELNRDNVSEILQLYMEAHSEQTEAAVSLRTKAFQAHSPSQKASMLAFLVNELCCSKAVISEIDKSIDYMTNLRKDKWAVEGKLRKLRSVHAKRTGKKDGGAGAEDNTAFTLPTIRNKRKRKDGDSEEEEDEEDDSDDQGDEDEDEEEEPGGKKGKKVDICDEEVIPFRITYVFSATIVNSTKLQFLLISLQFFNTGRTD
uniref:DDT domain-containing protein n=1 Tax=Salarias fasciatus TaxID=181472 RepID=A0A672IA54_SALFA